jgi:hypothetical protein
MSRPVVPYGANAIDTLIALEAVERRDRMLSALTHLLVLTKRAERLCRAFDRAAAEQDWARTNAVARAFFRLLRPSAG